MHKYLFLIFVLLFASVAHAAAYGHYNMKLILTVSETPSWEQYSINTSYLNKILTDLSIHAKNYPPQFDTLQDRQRATYDVNTLSGIFDSLTSAKNSNPVYLGIAAKINAIGHNLDIPGDGEKADTFFRRLLTVEPSNSRANYAYGTFLASVGEPKKALPYLNKALAGGITDANYTIGMTYLELGNKEKALKCFEKYKQYNPSDKNVDKLIDAIRNGKFKLKQSPSRG